MTNRPKHTDQSEDNNRNRRATAVLEVVAPADPNAGVLGRAVSAGDYRTFRMALAGYEEWIRKRVGRWIQRFPEAEARIGRGLAIGDVLEAVYLNAFEHYGHRPVQVPFHQWLEDFIDPSLKGFLRHPEAERENASLARTVRQAPLK